MFKKLKIVDIIVLIGITIMIAVGFLTYKHVRQTASGQIETTAKVGFHVFLRGVTLTGGEIPLKAGEKTFITIRNVPYKKVEIANVQFSPRNTLIADKNGNYQPVIDVSTPSLFDFVVTVKDKAKVTDDGAVVGGNKVKMGIPVILEGQKYKFTGVVSNVQFADNPEPQPEPQQPVENAENGR